MKCIKCRQPTSGSALLCSACGEALSADRFAFIRGALWLLRMPFLAWLLIFSGKIILEFAAPEIVVGSNDSIDETWFNWAAAGYVLLAAAEATLAAVLFFGDGRSSLRSAPVLGSELKYASVIAMIFSFTHFVAGSRVPQPGDMQGFGISLALSATIFGLWSLIEKLVGIRERPHL